MDSSPGSPEKINFSQCICLISSHLHPLHLCSPARKYSNVYSSHFQQRISQITTEHFNQSVCKSKQGMWLTCTTLFFPYDMRKILMYEIAFGISIQLSQSEALWNTSNFCNPDGLSGLFMKLLHSVNSRKSEIFNNIYQIIELYSQKLFCLLFLKCYLTAAWGKV